MKKKKKNKKNKNNAVSEIVQAEIDREESVKVVAKGSWMGRARKAVEPSFGFIVLALVAFLVFFTAYIRISGVWEERGGWNLVFLAVICAACALVSILLYETYLYYEDRSLLTKTNKLFAVAALIALSSILTAVTTVVSYTFVAAPIAIILCGLLVSRRAAYTMSVLMSGICLLLTLTTSGPGAADKPLMIMLAVLIGGIISVLVLNSRQSRTLPILSGLVGGAASALVTAGILAFLHTDLNRILADSAWMLGGGIICGVAATGLLPVFETVFDVATDARLNELMNNNNPLLKRLMIEAPGTYHHSLIVGVLAESAAEIVGANPLLCKTAAYYHDVGKLVSPKYFRENQGEYNIHDELEPIESVKRILAHQNDGAAMLAKNRFPSELIKVASRHHGDSVMVYFYNKALERAEDKSTVLKSDYTYDGEKPKTKESAVLMLADCCEAAVRAIKRPTAELIEERVKSVIKNLWLPDDAQLSECPLTAADIHNIEKSFIKNLLAQYHERIEYPQNRPQVEQASAPQIESSGAAGDEAKGD